MPLQLDVDADEVMTYTKRLTLEDGTPFGFGLSTKTLFLPGKRWFAVSDPSYFRKLPLASIVHIWLRMTVPWVRSTVFGALFLYSVGELVINAVRGLSYENFKSAGLMFVAGYVLWLWCRPRPVAVVYLQGTRRVRVLSPDPTSRRDQVLLQRFWRRFAAVCKNHGISVKGRSGLTTA